MAVLRCARSPLSQSSTSTAAGIASEAAVKASFRRLSRLLHPDKHQQQAAQLQAAQQAAQHQQRALTQQQSQAGFAVLPPLGSVPDKPVGPAAQEVQARAAEAFSMLQVARDELLVHGAVPPTPATAGGGVDGAGNGPARAAGAGAEAMETDARQPFRPASPEPMAS